MWEVLVMGGGRGGGNTPTGGRGGSVGTPEPRKRGRESLASHLMPKRERERERERETMHVRRVVVVERAREEGAWVQERPGEERGG